MRASSGFRRLLPVLLPLLAAAPAAHALTLAQDVNGFASDARAYNLITFGNANLNGSSDTEGGIAVGGNLAVGSSWTIASQTSAGADPSLYVAGQVSGNLMLNNGYASTPALSSSNWTWNSTHKTLTDSGVGEISINSSGAHTTTSPISNPAPSNWNWSTLKSSAQAISSSLAGMSATGTVGVSGQNLVFSTTQTSGAVVFDLDASELSGNSYDGQTISNIQINVPSGVDYIINVTNLSSGQTLFGSGVNFNSGTNDDQLLWNFEGATNVTIDNGGDFYGSVLAPNTNLSINTTIDGQIIANSITDCSVELHYDEFSSVLVPEPWFYALAGVAVCGAAIAVRRRRSLS